MLKDRRILSTRLDEAGRARGLLAMAMAMAMAVAAAWNVSEWAVPV